MKGIGASLQIALLLAAIFVTSGCDQRPVATPNAPSGPAGNTPGNSGPASALPKSSGAAGPSSMQVRLDPALVAGFQVQPVAVATLADTLRVAGRVDFNEQSLARIGSTVTGRVIDLQASLGQRVRVGQTLATLNSAELSSAQLAYLKTVAQARLLATAAERAQQLFAADVIAQAELQRREHAAEVARAEQSGAADQLAVLGMTPAAIAELLASNAINSVKPVISRVAGTVVERSVAVGQVVQPADTLFTVADLSRVWVLANVPEQQATSVQVGQATEIEVPSLGRTLSGRIVHISAVVDPQSRTVLARCELDNVAGELKPAMLANLLIRTAGRQVMVVPAAAVVRENNRDHVYVQSATNVFVLTPVDLGPPADGDVRPVIKGLEAGQKIVVNGAFHLNNERRKQELQ
jgi:cobalt-zinc-cadmium efflux system membrane fusion protein